MLQSAQPVVRYGWQGKNTFGWGLATLFAVAGCSSSSPAVPSDGAPPSTQNGAVTCVRELVSANYNCIGYNQYCIPSGACEDAGACPGTCSNDPSSIRGTACLSDSDCAVGLLCLTPQGHECAEQNAGCTCAASSYGGACTTSSDCTPFEWSCYSPYGLDYDCVDGGNVGHCWCQCNGCTL